MSNPQYSESQVESNLDLEDIAQPTGQSTSTYEHSDIPYGSVCWDPTAASPRSLTAQPDTESLPRPQASPFSYAGPSDPSLLTPVSSVASPPLHHRVKNVDVGPPYDACEIPHPSPVSDCSGMYLPSYDLGAASQSSSPMNIPAPVTADSHFDMANLIDTPPANDVPEFTHYFGSYAVSESSSVQTPAERAQDMRGYQYPSATALPNGSLQVGPHQQLYSQRPIASMASEQPSMLTPQDPMSFRPSRNISPVSYQDVNGLSADVPSVSVKRERPATRQRVRKPRRRAETSRSSGRSVSGLATTLMSSAPRDTARQGKGQGAGQSTKPSKPTLTLNDDAPADLKRLLELRKQYYDDKGKGMWDVITRVFNAEFGEHDRARLQMKLTRGVTRFAELPKAERDRIVQAYEEDERQKYERICARLTEMGGGEVWPWKPAQIEAHLVTLGMEDKLVDEKTNLRRRKREAQRKRSTAGALPVTHHSADGITVEWVGGARPPPGPGQPATLLSQAQQFGGMDPASGMRRSSVFELAGGDGNVIDQHFFSNQDHDDLMKQIEQKYYPAEADNSPHPGPDIHNQQHHQHILGQLTPTGQGFVREGFHGQYDNSNIKSEF